MEIMLVPFGVILLGSLLCPASDSLLYWEQVDTEASGERVGQEQNGLQVLNRPPPRATQTENGVRTAIGDPPMAKRIFRYPVFNFVDPLAPKAAKPRRPCISSASLQTVTTNSPPTVPTTELFVEITPESVNVPEKTARSMFDVLSSRFHAKNGQARLRLRPVRDLSKLRKKSYAPGPRLRFGDGHAEPRNPCFKSMQ